MLSPSSAGNHGEKGRFSSPRLITRRINTKIREPANPDDSIVNVVAFLAVFTITVKVKPAEGSIPPYRPIKHYN